MPQLPQLFYMDYTEQGTVRPACIRKAFDEGKTCIDCHRALPQLPQIDQHIGKQNEARWRSITAISPTAEKTPRKISLPDQSKRNPGLVPGFCFDGPENCCVICKISCGNRRKAALGQHFMEKGMLLLSCCRQYGQFS